MILAHDPQLSDPENSVLLFCWGYDMLPQDEFLLLQRRERDTLKPISRSLP